MKIAFLGGPKDGERLNVDKQTKRLIFPVPVPPLVGTRNEFEAEPEVILKWVYVYEKEVQRNNLGDSRLVMVYRGEEQR